MNLKLLGKIIKINLLIFFKIPFIACIMLLLITAILFPTAGLTGSDVCKPVEMLLPFLGTITMVPIFLPEQDLAIFDSVAGRKIGMNAIYIMRLLIAILFIILFVSAFCAFLRMNECSVPIYVVWGGITSAFFMGSIGFFAAGVSKNVINGMLVSMIYYLSNLGLKKQLGVFFLFRMSTGVFEGKLWLLVAGLVLVILTFVIKPIFKNSSIFFH